MVQNGLQGTSVSTQSSSTAATVVALRGRKKGWPGHLGICVLAGVDGTALLVTSCVSQLLSLSFSALKWVNSGT